MSDEDARDAHLLETGQIDRLLATHHIVIVGRCIARTNVHDGQDVAQDVEFRLFREFQAGKRYPGVPYRVVVGNVIKWTLADHFGGRPTDVPLPDGWETAGSGFADEVIDRLWLADLVDALPRLSRRHVAWSTSRGLAPIKPPSGLRRRQTTFTSACSTGASDSGADRR